MEKSARTLSGRGQLPVLPPSPRLVRSRSGSNPAITTPERYSQRFSSSERFTNSHRSKSTSKMRTHTKELGNIISPTSNTTSISNKFQENKKSRDGFGKFFQRGVSPSAWALSPGRLSLGSPIGPESLAKAVGGGSGVGGGVTKVWKYFKQRKASSKQEEEFHRFRILHNRLLQWRFITARANVAMTNVKNVAEIQLFSVWVRMVMLRKITIQKRIELRKVKQMMKLYEIMNGQLWLLIEWAKLERRNQESISRLTRKLSALSTTVPLTHGLKADTESVFEAINTAIKVMENIEPLITKYQTQHIERILYRVTELITTSKQEEEYLQELLEIVPVITTLLENERSIRVHLIQTEMRFSSSNYPYTISQSCI